MTGDVVWVTKPAPVIKSININAFANTLSRRPGTSVTTLLYTARLEHDGKLTVVSPYGDYSTYPQVIDKNTLDYDMLVYVLTGYVGLYLKNLVNAAGFEHFTISGNNIMRVYDHPKFTYLVVNGKRVPVINGVLVLENGPFSVRLHEDDNVSVSTSTFTHELHVDYEEYMNKNGSLFKRLISELVKGNVKTIRDVMKLVFPGVPDGAITSVQSVNQLFHRVKIQTERKVASFYASMDGEGRTRYYYSVPFKEGVFTIKVPYDYDGDVVTPVSIESIPRKFIGDCSIYGLDVDGFTYVGGDSRKKALIYGYEHGKIVVKENEKKGELVAELYYNDEFVEEFSEFEARAILRFKTNDDFENFVHMV